MGINIHALNEATEKYCDLVSRKQINPAEIDVVTYISELYSEKLQDYEFSTDCISREKRKIPRTAATVTQESENQTIFSLTSTNPNVKGVF